MKSDRKKMFFCMFVSVAGALVGLLAGILFTAKPDSVTTLSRGTGAETVRLYVLQEGEKAIPVDISLAARELTGEETEALMNRAYKEILDELKGENASLEEIEGDLHFIYSWKTDGREMEVFWQIPEDCPVSSGGTVERPDEIVKSDIGMTLCCGETKREWEIHLTFLPEKEAEESLDCYIQSNIDRQSENQVILPESFQNKKLTYQTEEPFSAANYMVPGFLSGVLLWVSMRQKEAKRKEVRKAELEKEYPDFTLKIALLYGAGLSMRSIWERLTKESSVGENLKYEIEQVDRKIKSGVPETVVYWEFGELCGLQQYRRLAGIMEQTVTKGAKGLAQLLDDAARDSLQERKAAVKQRGEETNSKLLLPMAMTLAVVIVLIMVPALATMRGGL